MIIAGIIAWYIAGIISHVYWVTAKYDYKTDDISTSIMAGIIGPIAFLVGWGVYGPEKPGSQRILFHKRDRKSGI